MPRSKPKKLITLDTETYEGLKGDIKKLAIYDGNEVIYGNSFDDVFPHLKELSKTYNLHIYIHNAEFDLRKLGKSIFSKGNVLWGQTKLINGKYVIVTCKYFVIHDSFRLLPKSLKKLSEDFDLRHGKLDLWEEVQKIYPNQYKDIVDYLDRCKIDDELFLKYLGYDVISLYELIEKLCIVSGLDFDTLTKCMTTASMSKKIFKYGFNGIEFRTEGESKTDFEILTKNKWWSSLKSIKNNYSSKPISYIEIEEKIRQSYFGGRTEVFKPMLFKSNEVVGYHMDFNSLYPSVMVDNEFPIGAPVFYDDEYDIKVKFRIWQRERNGLGFIKAKVYIPKTHIPPLPVRKEKLFFATGYIVGTWTYNELEHAINKYNVEVIEFIEMIHFTATFKIFKNLINVFSDIKIQAKKDKNSALYELAKLIMNTSYGWTALRRDDKTELKDIEKLEQFKTKLINENHELGYIEIQSNVLSDTIQVQIASYVTSYARLKLLNAFEILEEQNADIYYCDTDSIVTNKLLPDEMLDKTTLGLLDVEGELKEGIFIFPKVYYEETTTESNIKFKGVTRQTQKTFDRNFIYKIYDKLCEGVEDEILLEENVDVFRSISYLQKKGKEYNNYEVRDKYLYLKNKQKRIMNYKENYTQPYHFNSFEEFETFNFKIDYDLFRDDKGNLFNPIL